MKTRNTEAVRLETDYLNRVAVALTDRDASEVEEILQSLREHIEEELPKSLEGNVSLVQMANVLERLGPPEAYTQEEDAVHRGATSPKVSSEEKRLSKLALASALCLPSAILVSILVAVLAGRAFSFDAAVLLGIFAGAAVTFAAFVLGIAALRAIRDEPQRFKGRGLAWVGVSQVSVLAILFLIAALSWLMYAQLPREKQQFDAEEQEARDYQEARRKSQIREAREKATHEAAAGDGARISSEAKEQQLQKPEGN